MPTLNDVLSGSLAQAVQVQQIIDAMKGTPNKGVPVAFVSLNDPNNYALSVQNDDPTNSRALSVLKADGTALITADATGVTLGSPLNLPTGIITSAMIADGTIQTADIAPGAVNSQIGQYGPTTPSFSTTSTSGFVATPMTVTGTTAGNGVRVFGFLTWQHTASGGAADVSLFVDGSNTVSISRQYAPFASASVSVAWDVILGMGAASHTFAIYLSNLVAGTLSLGIINAFLGVVEVKR